MFQFSPLAAIHLCIQCKADWLSQPGCPIRISTDQRLLAAPRSFSQLSTSFVASRCLGIHRAPLVAFPIPKARITTFRFETRVRSKVMSGRSQTHQVSPCSNAAVILFLRTLEYLIVKELEVLPRSSLLQSRWDERRKSSFVFRTLKWNNH